MCWRMWSNECGGRNVSDIEDIPAALLLQDFINDTSTSTCSALILQYKRSTLRLIEPTPYRVCENLLNNSGGGSRHQDDQNCLSKILL